MGAAPTVTTVADVMVRRPKTLPADATVADARTALEKASVKLLLLVDGNRFRGAVSEVPADADPNDAAINYADDKTPIVTEDVSVSVALERLQYKPSGRLVVLGEDQTLAGLVCLTTDGKSFCGKPAQSSPPVA